MNATIRRAHEIRKEAAARFGGRPGDYSLKIACEMAKNGEKVEAERKMSGEEIAELLNNKYSCQVVYAGFQKWESKEKFLVYKTKKSKSIAGVLKFDAIPDVEEIDLVAQKFDSKGKKAAVAKVAELLKSGEAGFAEWETDSGKKCFWFDTDVAEHVEYLDLESVTFEFLAKKRGQEWRTNISLGKVFERGGKKGVYGYTVK